MSKTYTFTGTIIVGEGHDIETLKDTLGEVVMVDLTEDTDVPVLFIDLDWDTLKCVSEDE